MVGATPPFVCWQPGLTLYVAYDTQSFDTEFVSSIMHYARVFGFVVRNT